MLIVLFLCVCGGRGRGGGGGAHVYLAETFQGEVLICQACVCVYVSAVNRRGLRGMRGRGDCTQYFSEPGIHRGNEDSHGNENRKSRKRGFSRKWKSKIVETCIFRGKKEIDKHTCFLWQLRWWIYERKLKVKNWYSSWILACYISSNSRMPQIAQILVSTFTIFLGGAGVGGGGREHARDPPRNFLFFFISSSRHWFFMSMFVCCGFLGFLSVMLW